MNSVPHRIRSLRWQVGPATSAEAFRWRSLLHEQGSDLLLPLFEKGFDETLPDGVLLHVPRLEFTIRLKSGDELEKALSSAIPGQLREQIHKLMTAETTATTPLATTDTALAIHGFQQLLQYLQSGSLPWHACGSNSADQADKLRSTCRDEWPRLHEYLLTAQEAAPFYFRLLQLLTDEQCRLLMRDIFSRVTSEMSTAIQQLLQVLHEERSAGCSFSRTSLLAALLAECGNRRLDASSLEGVIHSAISALAQQEQSAPTGPAVEIAALIRRTGFTSAQHVRVEHDKAPLGDQKPSTGTAGRGVTADKAAAVAIPGEQDQVTRSDLPAELLPLLVRQAGLVLLHPFISRFFEACNLTEAGCTHLCSADLPRAAALLQFLASGREELYEFELGFIKILLGMRPDSPLPVCAGLLTTEDRTEAEQLLQSAVTHWSVLKSSSIQALRSSFIERQGIVRETDNSWRLNIDRTSYDILLEQLPWSISIIKLPWMRQAVVTEW
ncbi:MAG TPA: hypothetical protein HPP94_02660 [Desulfuromonadales bacterium]|nr:hypothetical protein [Desulfuromonadales bacterium]